MAVYKCDPEKNLECTKEHCYIYGGECELTKHEEYRMENEIRYYLKQILACMEPDETDPTGAHCFKPSYIVTAVKLPTGAIELAINDKNIKEKLEYILEAYDDDMRLKTNTDIVMQNIMVV